MTSLHPCVTGATASRTGQSLAFDAIDARIVFPRASFGRVKSLVFELQQTAAREPHECENEDVRSDAHHVLILDVGRPPNKLRNYPSYATDR
jgi:hypothetical protein